VDFLFGEINEAASEARQATTDSHREINEGRQATLQAIKQRLEMKVSRGKAMEIFSRNAKEIMAENLCGYPTDLFLVLNHKQWINMLTELGFKVVVEDKDVI